MVQGCEVATSVKKILITDDHDLIRRGLRTLVETRPNLKVVAEAATGLEAIEAARETNPDIAILDYSLPELNGLDLTIALRAILPRLEVLIYTMHEREALMVELLQAGARGFVLKSETEAHLLAAVDALALHRPYYSGAMSDTLVARFQSNKPSSETSSLTMRERGIVQLIAEGRMNKEVARMLSISVKTVECHRAAAMQKLDLRTTAELVRYAVRNNIVQA